MTAHGMMVRTGRVVTLWLMNVGSSAGSRGIVSALTLLGLVGVGSSAGWCLQSAGHTQCTMLVGCAATKGHTRKFAVKPAFERFKS